MFDLRAVSLRAEAAEVGEPPGAAHGPVWRQSTQGGHADRRRQLQPHRAEREGPQPRAGHQRGLLPLQTPLLRGLVLLEHRNTGERTSFLLLSRWFQLEANSPFIHSLMDS